MKNNLVEVVMRLLNCSMVTYEGETIDTEVRCPQGSCLSPLLWNLYISQLSQSLNNIPASNLDNFLNLNPNIRQDQTQSLLFTDDLVVVCHGKDKLNRV